jgi:hypothetical protein
VEETGGKRAATKKKSLEIVLDGALTDGAAVAEPAKKTAKKAERREIGSETRRRARQPKRRRKKGNSKEGNLNDH